jgi:hypothetical protein
MSYAIEIAVRRSYVDLESSSIGIDRYRLIELSVAGSLGVRG